VAGGKGDVEVCGFGHVPVGWNSMMRERGVAAARMRKEVRKRGGTIPGFYTPVP
jgi:hypothetical protein